MKIVVELPAGPAIASIQAFDSRHTVADLAAGIAAAWQTAPHYRDPAVLMIDGVPIDPSTALADSGLRPGSRVTVSTTERRRIDRPGSAVGVLDVVGGLDAGRQIALRPGRYVIGRLPSIDLTLDSPTISRRHARLDVTSAGELSIADLGSRNGTMSVGRAVGGDPVALEWSSDIRLGSTTLAARRCDPTDVPHHLARQSVFGGIGERHVFNRQPRRLPDGPGPNVAFPERRKPEHHTRRFSWAAIVAPLLMGAAMAVLWNPLFALFVLLSPVLTVANWWEERHQHRREHKRIERDFRADLERFEVDLVDVLAAEHRRRWRRHCNLGEVCRRAVSPSVHLWERRTGHDDALRVAIGRGDRPWLPPSSGESPEPEVVALLAKQSRLVDIPIEIDLSDGAVLGVTGDAIAGPARALVRSIVAQLAVHHGPADLELGLLTEPHLVRSWDWMSLLPHVVDAEGGSVGAMVGASAKEIGALVDGWLQRGDDARPLVVVIDGDSLLEGRGAPARLLAAVPGISVVVIAPHADWLPDRTETIVATSSRAGLATMTNRAGESCAVLLDGLPVDVGWRVGSALARFDDPEMRIAGAGVPDAVGLCELLGASPTAGLVRSRWETTRRTRNLATPIGVDAHGVVDLDLVTDGPHGLVGGTTGSGKSELLRSIVASLAASADAETVSFLLVDYKGGSAFDGCVGLPHTVGIVTDLDPQLSERALRCLEAELEHRERVLRASETTDIDAYWQARETNEALDPLPRLVVVIDEFATLRAELPEFVSALIGVAQRGRSLGVHLILATQRPTGAVDDNIRTNTNIRIALRVLDTADSVDVVDVADAAQISASVPGRACMRLGPGLVSTFQSARVTGELGSKDPSATRLRVVAMSCGAIVSDTSGADGRAEQPGEQPGTTELEELVAAVREAHAAAGFAPPRRPWPEPLGTNIALSLATASGSPDGDGVALGVVDDPGHQQQFPLVWSEGNALVAGASQSGKTTTLRTIVVANAAGASPTDFHCYVLDFGSGALADLAQLPHVGAVVHGDEFERQQRLLHLLADEVERRRTTGDGSGPRVLFVLDGLDAFRRKHDDQFALIELFDSVYLDGPAVGVHTVVTAAAPSVLRRLAAVTRFRLYLRLNEPTDYREIGVVGAVDAEPPPGRGFVGPSGLGVQVAEVDPSSWDRAATAWSDGPAAMLAHEIGVLGHQIALADLSALQHERSLPIGRSARRLETAGIGMAPGEHFLIVGPARSGRSTALQTIAASAAKQGCEFGWLVSGVQPDPQDKPVVGRQISYEDLAHFGCGDGPTMLLVDDADLVDDPDGELARLVSSRDVVVVASGRSDRLRTAYQHWTNEFRNGRRGLLLWPDLLDGDAVGVGIDGALVRSVAGSFVPGRGILVADASHEVVQVATETNESEI